MSEMAQYPQRAEPGLYARLSSASNDLNERINVLEDRLSAILTPDQPASINALQDDVTQMGSIASQIESAISRIANITARIEL